MPAFLWSKRETTYWPAYFKYYSPHFIAVCQPENMAELCPVEGPPIYVTDFNCTATNLRRLQDSRYLPTTKWRKCNKDDLKIARIFILFLFYCLSTNVCRLSFPSGHASVSAYTMLFLAFYLQSRMTWSGSKLLRHTIQIGALLMAWFTGLSRISDYKHHWSAEHVNERRKMLINSWIWLLSRSDVLTGYLIGAISASLTVSTVYNIVLM